MAATVSVPGETNVSGRLIALNAAITMASAKTIAVCGDSSGSGGGGTIPPGSSCGEFVTGGGWIYANSDATTAHKSWWSRWFRNDKATFGVSGGIKNGEYWGQLSYNDHGRDGIKVKSTEITGYVIIDAETRQIDGIAKVDGSGSYTFTVIIVDNGEPGREDSFSLEVSNGYSASGTVSGGNIQIHSDCDKSYGYYKYDKYSKCYTYYKYDKNYRRNSGWGWK
jgi:hypothetical protein